MLSRNSIPRIKLSLATRSGVRSPSATVGWRSIRLLISEISAQAAYILTAFNRNTVSGRALHAALGSGGIPRKYVVHDGDLPESAYVGHMTTGRVESAISVMSVGESRELSAKIRHVVPRFKWVIFDCNLSREMISHIAKMCKDMTSTSSASQTSDAKAPRLTEASEHGMRAACMNRAEAEQLIRLFRGSGTNPGAIDDAALARLRAQLNADYLMVTDGRDGWYLVDAGTVTHHDRPEGVVPVNSLGAGDAAAAGLVDSLVRGSSIPDGVSRAVTRSLRSQYPTQFAEGTSPEAWLKQRRRARFVQAGAYLAAVIATLVVETVLLALWNTTF